MIKREKRNILDVLDELDAVKRKPTGSSKARNTKEQITNPSPDADHDVDANDLLNTSLNTDPNVPLNASLNTNANNTPSTSLNITSFRFSKVCLNYKAPIPAHNQFFIRLFPGDPVYGILSTRYSYKFFNHNIPEILNTAPTIDQLWHNLLVYRNELDDSGPKSSLIKREPSTEFFTLANESFASNRNAKGSKYKNRIPLYYYMYDIKNKKPLHVPLWEAKRMFCKMYENYILNTPQCRNVLEIILKTLPFRDSNHPIIIRGYSVPVDSMSKVINLKEKYDDDHSNFSPEYCLAEILMHYSDIKLCSWNVDDRENYVLREDLMFDSLNDA